MGSATEGYLDGTVTLEGIFYIVTGKSGCIANT